MSAKYDWEDWDNALFEAIKHFIQQVGYAPTVRELGAMMKVNSPATVWEGLERLRNSGRIRWVHGNARTIRILHDPEKTDTLDEFRKALDMLSVQLPNGVWHDFNLKAQAVLSLVR